LLCKSIIIVTIVDILLSYFL